MPSFELLLTFFITTGLFAFMPGPSVLYTVARTLASGRKAGLIAVLGIHRGAMLM
jgi:threonine/homoserine/homoserine lactone efflux protein